VPRSRGGADLLPGRGTADVPPGRGTGAVPGHGAPEVPGTDVVLAPGRPVRGTGQVAVPGRGAGQATPPVRAKAAAAVAALPAGDPAVPGRATAPRPATVVTQDEDSPGGLWAAGSELRAQLREKRRLRVITLVTLSVVVLGLLPLLFGIRSTTRDPVFNSLDALGVPSWAGKKVEDRSSGSRWCFLDCRFRERTAQSDRPFKETDKVYAEALASAGWKARGGECTDQPTTSGKYTCWTRDEFTLDLWVRLPECAVDAVAAQDPGALPSTGPDGVVAAADPSKCTGSTVSIKVQNSITDERGRPEPAVDPSLVGETPDPVLTNDPLLEPTPSAS
jgi:integrin beta 3